MESGMQPLSNQDLVLLSAYLDGELSEAEHQTLEKRLEAEPDLLAELESLQEVVQLARSLPQLKAPRDFRLDPAIYGKSSTQRPWITKIGSLSRPQLSSLVGLAAALILVSGFLLVNNPFSGKDASTSSKGEQADVAQLALTDTTETNMADGAVESAANETAVAILPTETFNLGNTGEQTSAPSPAPTLETARAFPTQTPLPTSTFFEGEDRSATDETTETTETLDDAVPNDNTAQSDVSDDVDPNGSPPGENASGSGGGPPNSDPVIKTTDEPVEQQSTGEPLAADDDSADGYAADDEGDTTDAVDEDYATSPQASAADTGIVDDDGGADTTNPSAPPSAEEEKIDTGLFGYDVFTENNTRILITLITVIINVLFH